MLDSTAVHTSNGRALEPSFTVDFAGEIDTPAQILAERLGVSEMAARRVLEWHAIETAATVRREVALMMARVIGLLIKPAQNLRALVWGLAFSWGQDQLNGAHSQAEVAREMNLERASISHYKRLWDRLLGSPVRRFGKSAAACAKLSEARRRVVARTAGGTGQ